MSGEAGRVVEVYWGDDSPPELIEGVREKSIALAGEPINVSDGRSDGQRELLDVTAGDTVDISVSGITKNDALKRAWASRQRLKPAVFKYADGSSWAGLFYLASYTDNGPFEDALAFEASFQNSGTVVYTPAT